MPDDNQTIEIIKDIAVLKEQGRTMELRLTHVDVRMVHMSENIQKLLDKESERRGIAWALHAISLAIGSAIGSIGEYINLHR